VRCHRNSRVTVISIIARDEDRCGRKLRNMQGTDRIFGAELVGEGLARWYAGGRRPWC